jgi:hypothetical protein
MAKIIQLSKGYTTIIDDEDYELVSNFNWRAVLQTPKHIYATSSKRPEYINVSMHRLIMGVTDRKIKVDHIDHDGLNNQKSNLRLCTHSQNMANRISKKKYMGIWVERGKYWFAGCKKNGTTHKVSAKSEIDAALKYNELAKILHGEFARLNVIE